MKWREAEGVGERERDRTETHTHTQTHTFTHTNTVCPDLFCLDSFPHKVYFKGFKRLCPDECDRETG